jgi:hypothetical protein
LSVVSVASAAYDAVTPADETPRHSSVETGMTRLICRIGFNAPEFVSRIEGSRSNGTAYPPDAPARLRARSRKALASVTSCTAADSSRVNRTAASAGPWARIFPNADE